MFQDHVKSEIQNPTSDYIFAAFNHNCTDKTKKKETKWIKSNNHSPQT